ncbi:hypothetical protein HRED_03045, partial [Candidatus Haloredivivus sp. G17]
MFNKFKNTVKDLSSEVKEKVTEKEIDESDVDPILEKFRLKLLENNVSYEAAEGIEEAVKKGLVGENAGRFSVEDRVDNLEIRLDDVTERDFQDE